MSLKIFSKDKKLILKFWEALGIIFIFLIFFFLRLYQLGHHDLWYDEVGSVSYARSPWRNWNAPLYWIFLHYWIKIFSISEFNLRFPSLIFSFLSVVLILLLGRELFSKKVGIFASLLMGLSPFHLWYAQEARDYSMVLFFGILSSYLLFKALKEKSFKLWLPFILVSIVGLYTNYFYIFLFFAQGLYFLLFRKAKMSFKEVAYFSIIALGFSLYLPRFLSKFSYVWQGFWIPEPEWRSLIITLENFMLGYSGFSFLYFISNILMGLFLICVLIVVYKKRDLRQSFAFCLFLFFIPIVLVFFFSKVFFSIYLVRGLIIFSPYFYLILSLGIVSLNRNIRTISLSILILILLVGDYGYFKDWMVMPFEYHTGTYIKKPIKPTVRFLEENLKPQDIIAFTNESAIPSFTFYSERKLRPFYFFFDPELLDSSWQRPIQESNYYIPFYKINHLKFKRLWVISSDWARSGKLDRNSLTVKNWLDKNLKLQFSEEFDGLWVFKYVKDKS